MGAASFALLSTLAATAAAQTVVNIGTLPGGTFSWPNAISDDGAVALVTSDSFAGFSSSTRACRWTANQGLVDLGQVGAAGTQVYAIGLSSDGARAACVAIADPIMRAMYWSNSGGFVGLPLPPMGGQTCAEGVSADGWVQVGWSSASGGHRRATRWPGVAAPTILGMLPGHTFSSAEAANHDGSVVVGVSVLITATAYQSRAFKWTAPNGMLSLGAPPGWDSTCALLVSRPGTVIAGIAGHGSIGLGQAFVWTATGGFELIGVLPGSTYSEPRAINEDGSMVIGQSYTVPGFSARPFVWMRSGGIVPLTGYLAARGFDLSHWTPLDVRAMSPDGRTIVGQASFAGSNHSPGYIASIWPDPACYANRDGSTTSPILNIQDFSAFIAQFTAGSPQANCDRSTAAPALNIHDYACYLVKFSAGCP